VCHRPARRCGRPNFFFEGGHFAAQLINLERGAIGVELHAMNELLLGGGEFVSRPRPWPSQGRSWPLILGGGLLGDETPEGIVITLETVAERDGGGELAFVLAASSLRPPAFAAPRSSSARRSLERARQVGPPASLTFNSRRSWPSYRLASTR